ncbi:uncharacterized protein LOC119356750 [Triticum dicoccoides]|uniref:uncharacterized protein LOC119356750 n=1 Tax=Triticum dicoccoides TaxID=85692 RepID=UPI00162C11BF|nr:uncharacterized protein LOC119356750 [Triticum dicoccoides]
MDTAGSSTGRSGESMFAEELYQAGICMRESIRWIEAQEGKMEEIAHSDSDYDNLPDFRMDMVVLTERIFQLWHRMGVVQRAGWIGNEGGSMETQSKIGDGGEMEAGGKSSKGSRSSASLELENLLHRSGILADGDRGGGADSEELLDFLAMETQEWIVSQSDSQLRWETVPELTTEILLNFEEVVVDIAKVFENKKIREEAMAVLRFGFRLPAFSEQIDELRHEMCNFLRSFSSENKDIRNTMMKFISEPYLSRISKLKLISDRITMLQRMDSDFDYKVKSTMIKLKSESFLSAMEDELRRAGKEDSVEMEEKRFTAYHLYWERIWGKDGHSFENQTILSPMQFTHCTPRHIPIEAVAGSTLQIYSIKVSLVEPQKLPLEVYGVVAVRDAVDRHRNPLFLRSRQHCQILEENDSLLHLTGPVRAIVSTDTVYIEIQLIVKGATKSEDTALISTFGFYNADNSCTYLAKNALCTVELCCEQLKQSVQATILSVAVTPKQESLLFHGGRVVCYSVPEDGNEDIAAQVSSRQVLLLDSKGGRMPMASNDYLYLTRHVVSVELNGKLLVLIMAGSPSQTEITAQFLLKPEKYNTSKCEFPLADGSKAEITVAWSLVPLTMPQSGDSREDSGMATAGNSKGRSGESMLSEELCQAAIFMQKSICWIQALEKKMGKFGHYGSEEYKNLLGLKSVMYELSNKIFGRVDCEAQKRISTMQNACWISNKGKLTDTQTKIGDDIEMETGGKSSKGRSGEFELVRIGNEGRTVQTQSKIGDGCKSVSKQFNEQEQFKELPVSNLMSVAESVRNKIEKKQAETMTEEVVPRVSFKLGLLSWQFDELWDKMSLLVSTEPKFLAICMLIREPFARYCSTLKFISEVFNRLGEWVPDFGEQIESMRQDDEDKNMGGKVVNPHEAAKAAEEYYFNVYRRGWERRNSNFGSFEDPTLLSPMFFTRSLPGHTQVGTEVGRTMQVYYIKVAEREGYALEWPLKVYGVVAARDVVDYRRNILFLRTRDDCQILRRQDPFLHLTGPSRAIMSGGIMEPTVTIEVHLKLKGMVESKDRTLISKAFFYDEKDLDSGDIISTRVLRGLCEIELCCEQLEHSHQATILGVRVVRGSLPCGNGIKIVCSALPEDKTKGGGKRPSGCILLLDSQAGDMPVGEEGYLDLSRQVVSVKSRGRLEILMKAGEISGSVVFPTKFSNICRESCELGSCEVEITVAWSLLIENQYDISVMGAIQPYAWESIPRRPTMKLVGAC